MELQCKVCGFSWCNPSAFYDSPSVVCSDCQDAERGARKVTTYVTLTATNPQTGPYKVLAVGQERDTARQAGEAAIVGSGIYAETERKNLIIWPLGKVKRSPAFRRAYEEWQERLAEDEAD